LQLLLPWLILVSAVFAVAAPLLSEAPLTHDHPTHLFKSWHMATQLLPTFRVRGFSHYWVFGFPSDELVPPSELWVVLFRALTLGKLSWLQTYGISMFALLVLCASSMFCFTRQYFGTLAGVVAGVLMVWDPGGWAQGGWDWCITFGVWPVTLGACLILLSLVSLEKLIARKNARQFAIAGAWVAASFVAHQVTILFLPVMAALMLADHWLRRASSGKSVALVVAACGFGVSLSAFYLLPMLARAEQTLDLGVAGNSPSDVAQQLLELRLFSNAFPAFVVLGFVGAVVALRRRVPGAFFLAAGTGLFVFLSTDLVISAFHAERILPNLRKIEAERMLYGAKMLWFPLVAYALALPFENAREFLRRFRQRPVTAVRRVLTRWSLGLVVCGVLLLPYVEPSFERFKSAQIVKKVPGEQVDFWRELQQVWAHTSKLRAESREHYRIAYDMPMHDHLSTISPVFDNTLMYKVGYTPTQLFVGFPMYGDPRLFKELSVKYVVADHALSQTFYELERRFGKLYFYRFKDFDPRPFTVLGPGSAELVEFAPERVRVRVRGAGPDSRLKLHVSYMDHWRARENGNVLRIVPATVFDAEDPVLMEVPARDGEIVFEYVRRAPDWLGLIFTLGAVPAFWFGLRVTRTRPTWARLPTLTPRTHRLLLAAALLAAAGLGTALLLRFQSRKALVSKDSLFCDLKDGDMRVNGESCTRDGPFHWLCGRSLSVQAQRVSGLYGTHICLTASGDSLDITTRRRVGEFLLGRYDVRDGSGSVHAWLNDKDLGEVSARPPSQGLQFLQFDTRDFHVKDGTFRIQLSGSPLHCFDFRVPL
jgi:hypothetical protein